jgi:hypothetical protein
LEMEDGRLQTGTSVANNTGQMLPEKST